MRSRIAITAMLVLGMVLSTTGVGLAISGSAGSGSAGNAQYPTTPTTPTPPPPPESNEGGGISPGGNEGAPPPAQAPAGEVKSGQQEAAPAEAVQVTRQLTTTGESQLPFTGFAVIPILVVGIGLLLSGLFLRRRNSESHG